jgi:hypothetical protein
MAKRAAGQYYTQQPGPLNLETGEFTKAGMGQGIANKTSTFLGKYADPAVWGLAAATGEAFREKTAGGDGPLTDMLAKAYNGVPDWIANLWHISPSNPQALKIPK